MPLPEARVRTPDHVSPESPPAQVGHPPQHPSDLAASSHQTAQGSGPAAASGWKPCRGSRENAHTPLLAGGVGARGSGGLWTQVGAAPAPPAQSSSPAQETSPSRQPLPTRARTPHHRASGSPTQSLRTGACGAPGLTPTSSPPLHTALCTHPRHGGGCVWSCP